MTPSRKVINARRRKAEAEGVKARTPPAAPLAEPEWDAARSIHGGKYDEFRKIPDPLVWRWPNDRGVRRDVDCQITSWRGISIGASHHYAKIHIEQQQVWDPNEVAWRRFDTRVDTRFAEEKFEADVLTREAAITFIEAVVRAFYMGPEFCLKSSVYLDGESGEAGLQALLKHLRRDR